MLRPTLLMLMGSVALWGTEGRAAPGAPFDVAIYGATPAGVAAAIASRREGAKVLLVEELQRVGGMYTSGGMGLTDSFFMERRMLDGLYEEIHARFDRHYRARWQVAAVCQHGRPRPAGR